MLAIWTVLYSKIHEFLPNVLAHQTLDLFNYPVEHDKNNSLKNKTEKPSSAFIQSSPKFQSKLKSENEAALNLSNPDIELRKSNSKSAEGSSDEVVIVSVFGRGHLLAAKLQQDQIPVKLIEIGHLMGAWPPEDLAGPFGFFKSEHMSDLEVETVFD